MGWGVRHYLCKHWLPVLGDHGALIAVQGDAGIVEGLLGVLEDVVELGDASLEHRAEVAGDQRPADRCGGERGETKERTALLNIGGGCVCITIWASEWRLTPSHTGTNTLLMD